MTAVVGEGQQVLGVFTDGDLRRALDRRIDLHAVPMRDVMTPGGRSIHPHELAAAAAHLMETHRITALLVTDGERLVGALNVHDLMRAGVVLMPSPHRAAPLATVRLLVLDVDGVLTDGRLHYGPRGELYKSFHVRDGYGIKRVLHAGIAVAVISGRRSGAVRRRCRELGITHVFEGVDDKAVALARLTASLGIKPRHCACMGDDVPGTWQCWRSRDCPLPWPTPTLRCVQRPTAAPSSAAARAQFVKRAIGCSTRGAAMVARHDLARVSGSAR